MMTSEISNILKLFYPNKAENAILSSLRWKNSILNDSHLKQICKFHFINLKYAFKLFLTFSNYEVLIKSNYIHKQYWQWICQHLFSELVHCWDEYRSTLTFSYIILLIKGSEMFNSILWKSELTYGEQGRKKNSLIFNVLPGRFGSKISILQGCDFLTFFPA